MKADVAFGRVGFEVWRGIANLESHCKNLLVLTVRSPWRRPAGTSYKLSEKTVK
jgi:hypothetical protein